jgi:hypothetical protein
MLKKDKIENHIQHLQEKHDALDKEIQVLYGMHENDLKLEALKKQKLHLRDEIEHNKALLHGNS